MANYVRKFDWSNPIFIGDKEFPTTLFSVEDNENNIKQRRVGANAQGEYFTIDNGEIQPVMLQDYLSGITATGSKDKFWKKQMEEARRNLEKETNDYLTQSNDNTMVNNVPHRKYNTNSEYKAIKGGESHNQWENEHPNLNAWSYVPGAAALAVAGAPFVLGAGDALASTALGQAMTSTLSPLTQLILTGKYAPYINAGISSFFAARGLDDIMHGKFTPETAMDLAPLTQLIKPMYNTLNAGAKSSELTKDLSIYSMSDYNSNTMPSKNLKIETRLNGNTIDQAMREKTANDYMDFVGSNSYKDTFKKAGFTDDQYSGMLDFSDIRLDDGDFPSHVVYELDKNGALGVSRTNPENPEYGITLARHRKGRSKDELLFMEDTDNAFNHEMAHWATGNIGTDAGENLFYTKWAKDPNTPIIEKMMKYNEDLVSSSKFNQKQFAENLEKEGIKFDKSQLETNYKYLTDIQEIRSNTYSIIQAAKRNNISVDAYIDYYLDDTGNLDFSDAPEQLKNLCRVLPVDTIKKFAKKLLSISAPIGITTSFINSNNNSTYK